MNVPGIHHSDYGANAAKTNDAIINTPADIKTNLIADPMC